MGHLERVASLETISFLNEEKLANVESQNTPYFISGILGNKLITSLIVDNELVVNIISL